MVLTARRAQEFVEDILGGNAREAVDAFTLMNQAGIQMQSSRLWNCNVRTYSKLAYRLPFTGTSATYDHVGTTATITLTGAFTSYNFVPGDVVTLTVTGQTSTGGQARVLGRTDANVIRVELNTFFADASSVDFAMDTSHVALPVDFGTQTALTGTRSFTRYTYTASLTEVMEYETNELINTSFSVWYAIEWVQGDEKSQPVATLKVWPEPNGDVWDELSLVYRRGWLPLTSDDDVVSIPDWLEPLYLQYVRAFAAGYEDGQTPLERVAALDTAIGLVENGNIYASAKRRDVATQPSYGPASGRAIKPAGHTLSISGALARSQTSGSFFDNP